VGEKRIIFNGCGNLTLLTELKLTPNPGLADTSLQDPRFAVQNIPVIAFQHPTFFWWKEGGG